VVEQSFRSFADDFMADKMSLYEPRNEVDTKRASEKFTHITRMNCRSRFVVLLSIDTGDRNTSEAPVGLGCFPGRIRVHSRFLKALH